MVLMILNCTPTLQSTNPVSPELSSHCTPCWATMRMYKEIEWWPREILIWVEISCSLDSVSERTTVRVLKRDLFLQLIFLKVCSYLPTFQILNKHFVWNIIYFTKVGSHILIWSILEKKNHILTTYPIDTCVEGRSFKYRYLLITNYL